MPAKASRRNSATWFTVVGGLVAFFAVALERALDDGLELGIDVGAQRRELGDLHRQDVAARLGAVRRAENVLPEQKLREHDAEGEQIGARIGDRVVGLLG